MKVEEAEPGDAEANEFIALVACLAAAGVYAGSPPQRALARALVEAGTKASPNWGEDRKAEAKALLEDTSLSDGFFGAIANDIVFVLRHHLNG
jgi:hypothetical protein